jgi:hypothetical protein
VSGSTTKTIQKEPSQFTQAPQLNLLFLVPSKPKYLVAPIFERTVSRESMGRTHGRHAGSKQPPGHCVDGIKAMMAMTL